MADVNKVILIGRLTRDAELKYTQGGAAILTFSIAVNRRKKSGDQWVDEASFFDVVLYGKFGETLNQYLSKGKQVGVDGELRQDRWEQDGQNRSKIVIVADNVQLLGGNTGASHAGSGGYNQGASQNTGFNSNAEYNSSQPQRSNQNQGRPQPTNNFDAGQSFESADSFPEDIPF
ncbi:MAG: single-stranded DNA-binding protein [Treponemataceae bacterium]